MPKRLTAELCDLGGVFGNAGWLIAVIYIYASSVKWSINDW